MEIARTGVGGEARQMARMWATRVRRNLMMKVKRSTDLRRASSSRLATQKMKDGEGTRALHQLLRPLCELILAHIKIGLAVIWRIS